MTANLDYMNLYNYKSGVPNTVDLPPTSIVAACRVAGLSWSCMPSAESSVLKRTTWEWNRA